MSFGQRDQLLKGDDKTSPTLKSPIRIYAGDGFQEGFDFVKVSSVKHFETTIINDQNKGTNIDWFRNVLYCK